MASILRALKGTKYEPSPRYAHYAVPIRGKLYAWGGRTQDFSEIDPQKLKSLLETFDLHTEVWVQKGTSGSPPPGVYNGACAAIGDSMYVSCGHDGSNQYQNALHELDTTTLRWRDRTATGGPMTKFGCRMISYDGDKLALFGGFGYPTGPTQPGSKFIMNTKHTDGRGSSNEFHVFHTREGIWSSPPTTGDRPPPCLHFSFTAIDPHRAVLFGGRQEHGRVNDAYILDLWEMRWARIPNTGGCPWPVERAGHAACCINFGGQHPQLLVTGGVDKDGKTLRDAWLLDVDTGTWKEIPLPGDVQPRCSHTITAFSLGPGLTEITMFGGCPDLAASKPDDKQPKISETTVLHLESVKVPSSGGVSREWVLVSVGTKKQLGSSERLRAKMVKLQQRATADIKGDMRVGDTSPESRILRERIMVLEQRVQESERRSEEAERGREEVNRRLQVSEVRVRKLDTQLADTERLRQEEGRRAQEAERGRKEAEGRVREAERGRQEAERGRQEAKGRALEAEARLEEEQSFWVVGREEIQLTEEELGRGGWAVVKVATFRGTRVAAKCLHHLIISRHNRELFIREMTMAARVRHPNLLQFIGATLLGELIVLTELMPTSLRAVLGEADLSQQQVTSISLDIARALNYLHLMKPNAIIHRDISSANVLLDPAPNNTWRAKVSDYGSVNLLRKLQIATPGNPTYAAPEAHNPTQQSPKMDIFSFGVLLIETCTAQFPDFDIRERLLQSIRDPGMVDLIRQCTAEDIDTRPTANDIIRQLNQM